MTIFDDARRGILIGARLKNWGLDSTSLNSQEDSTGWTLLATAVVSGHPNQVEQLLEQGAQPTRRCRDGETPLLLAAWKTPIERPLILQKLLFKIPKEDIKEFIDQTCDLAENKTPLMYAIEKLDGDSVRLLVNAGARRDVKNNHGFNAVDLAKNTGKSFIVNALDPKEEQSKLARLASNVINVVRHVIWWVNDKFNGFMGRVFGFGGQRDEGTEKVSKYLRISQTAQHPTSC
jgi:ankyrin repeat protein